jgi:hypothetical protein
MRSPYSIYDSYYQHVLETINSRCNLQKPVDIPAPIVPSPKTPMQFCSTARFHTTKQGDTCDIIAQENNASSAALFLANQNLIFNCESMEVGARLCLPTPCEKTYLLAPTDTCDRIEMRHDLRPGIVKRFNPWVNHDCSNLQTAVQNMGRVICLSPPGGTFKDVIPPSGLPNQNNGLRGG